MTGDILDLGLHEAHNAALLTLKNANADELQYIGEVCLALLAKKDYPDSYRMRTLILAGVARGGRRDDTEGKKLLAQAGEWLVNFRGIFHPLCAPVPTAETKLEELTRALEIAEDIVYNDVTEHGNELQDLLRINPDYSTCPTPFAINKPAPVVEATEQSVQPKQEDQPTGIIPIIDTDELADHWEQTAKEFLQKTQGHDPEIVPRVTFWMASALQTMRKNIETGAIGT